MLTIQFNRGYKAYVKGDIAGFDNETANKLVGSGIASYFGSGMADRGVPIVPAEFPKQEKIQNLCAICGLEAESVEELKAHKMEAHNL